MSSAAPPTAPPPTGHLPTGFSGRARPDLSRDDVGCLRCGYNLRGLREDGACPECGTPVAQSLEGDLLEFSSPEYVASLHRGVVVVLGAILVMVLLVFVMVGAGAAGAGSEIATLLSFGSLGASAALLIGWWWFSAPDPGMLSTDQGDTPRRIVRITVLIQAASMLFQTGLSVVAPGAMLAPVNTLMGLVSLVAIVVCFFAQLLYVRWLAPRLPSQRVRRRAVTLMWMGPAVFVGSIASAAVLPLFLLVLLIGALVTLVMYWNMLDWVRKDIKALRANQALRGL